MFRHFLEGTEGRTCSMALQAYQMFDAIVPFPESAGQVKKVVQTVTLGMVLLFSSCIYQSNQSRETG